MSESLAEQHVREFTRACLRAGLLTADELRREVREAVAAELPALGDADGLADAWIGEAREALLLDQQGWSDVTDHERLQSAFAELAVLDVEVLQGVEDHWVAKQLLDDRTAAGAAPRGVVWFTAPDVWHAVDEGMLEVNLWHGTTANAAPGDALLADVLGVLEQHGLSARFDEGRIEVDAHWHRRIPR